MRSGTPLIFQNLPINPLEIFRRLEDDVSRAFNEGFSEVSSGYPPRNIWYDENGAYVVTELPGVTQDNIEATVVGRDTVVIKGTRNAPEYQESERIIRDGRQYGTFMRSISLPFDIDEKGMTANLHDGLLEIYVPRREEEKPKRIDIKTQ
ncbi:MAG: Hsp20/alpha crystallin family protein [SAR324 cluster bacterium]|uniref:Hsp20/alpha crystallin family protein n=1 Tax=SAR324 cluster bacterium TaxID=2024889 RepID=A0A7X9ILV9_9DELT|nr:Hsp20/alpha crystallin family protein [SAR324 cluster bacterium]